MNNKPELVRTMKAVMTPSETKIIFTTFGHTLEIIRDGKAWISPSTGASHATAGEAAREEAAAAKSPELDAVEKSIDSMIGQNFEVSPDDENNAEKFWGELDEAFPDVAIELRDTGRVQLSLLQWLEVQQLDGFSGGPEYAPHALIEMNPDPN